MSTILRTLWNFVSGSRSEEVKAPSTLAGDPAPAAVEEEAPKTPRSPVRADKVLPPTTLELTVTKATDLVCEVTGNTTSRHSDYVINGLKTKTERRARRHFAGKEVKHRITGTKTANSIEFSYFRRSGKPVVLLWTKPEPVPNHIDLK